MWSRRRLIDEVGVAKYLDQKVLVFQLPSKDVSVLFINVLVLSLGTESCKTRLRSYSWKYSDFGPTFKRERPKDENYSLTSTKNKTNKNKDSFING